MATFWVGFLFFMLLFTLAWELWPVAGVPDTRIRAVIIFLISAVAAHLAEWMVIEGNPAEVEMFNYFWFVADLILLLLIWVLAFNLWPIAGSTLDKQPLKGAVVSAGLLVMAFIVYFIANDDKARFADYTGLYIPTLFIMIPFLLWYTLLMEKWPIGGLQQPVGGVVVVAITGVFTWITYTLAADWVEIDTGEIAHMAMANRTWDYITFCGIWLFFILVFAFTLKGWPCMAGTTIGGQPMKGIVMLFVTGILAAVTMYVWLWAVGGEDGVINIGFLWPFSTDAGFAVNVPNELLLPGVWFWVVLPSLLLFLTLHCEGGA
jgi:hypothetical protein